MTDPNIDFNKLNPLAMWREWVAKSEAQWSEAAATLMKDPRAGGPLNKQVEEARLVQRMFGEMAQASLALVNLPSRTDLEGLDERLGRLEDGVANVSAELVRLREALTLQAAPTLAAAKPARTRKAPAPAMQAAKAAKPKG
jgi:hypothetical protein